MERYLVILLLPLLLLTGCAPYATHWRILKGNYDYINGRYQPATVAYLRILEEGHEREEIVHYNLGNVFYALGETAAAEEEWNLALEVDEQELRYRTLFNLGNLYFELSQYNQAYDRFRQALTIRPESVDAKRNLELMLQKLSSQEAAPLVPSQGGAAAGEPPGEDIERILQYIRRKEESQWVSQQNQEETDAGPYW